MSWQQFEPLVGQAFHLRGNRVAETGNDGADGGVDLVLTKDGDQVLGQCKQWRACKIGVTVMRELYGVMAARSAAAGIVVTSGRLTDDATDFATGRNIRLIDGHDLHALVRAARSAAPIPQRSAEAPPPAMGPAPVTAPACPACAKPMVRRMAKRGAQAGRAFWGCSDHPACKGTRTMR
ncbi:MAG TPA: restriction endonuclease [Methylibium sp.]|nr:restriction endonuclease [Methylibium sp.]